MHCLNMDDWNMNRYVVGQNDIGLEKGNEKILYSIQYTV